MFGRSQRRQDEESGSRFLANREQVRSWMSGWACPEIAWPRLPDTPDPWTGTEREWLDRGVRATQEYFWILEAQPLARGITSVVAGWWFGAGHTFERLDIEFRSVADPPYLAEMLTLGAHAASLKGWRDEDVPALHAWLFAGIDSRPVGQMLRGTKRTGFILFELVRAPLSSRDRILTRLRMTLTDTALDGTPLNAMGGTPPV